MSRAPLHRVELRSAYSTRFKPQSQTRGRRAQQLRRLHEYTHIGIRARLVTYNAVSQLPGIILETGTSYWENNVRST